MRAYLISLDLLNFFIYLVFGIRRRNRSLAMLGIRDRGGQPRGYGWTLARSRQ